jgi:SAM-dependent methyltransferase
VVEAARSRPVLDLACGRGRHALAVAERGAHVVAVDRDPEALAELAREARARDLPVSCVRADLEGAHGLPFAPAGLGAVLVFRYLWRPLAPALAAALAPGGLLLYETFTRDQGKLPYGPRNPAFLLEPGELPRLFPELAIEAFEEGHFGPVERPEALARLRARRT